MTAIPINGATLAAELRERFVERITALSAKGCRPGLAVVLVGSDPSSQVYVGSKVRSCEQLGIYSEKIEFPESTSLETLVTKIHELNANPLIHGILVQLPLPPHLEEARIFEAIDTDKDVDGFHAENVGALVQGNPNFIPCTPHGVMKMLEFAGIDPLGKQAVIIGRSNIVGKPIALLLLERHATVTVCHSRTPDLSWHIRNADIVVAAVGKPRMITGDMLKPGAVVIDVGINRLPPEEGGGLCGDLEYGSCSAVASHITPVPGGVGPMTITMLLANTIEAAERAAD